MHSWESCDGLELQGTLLVMGEQFPAAFAENKPQKPKPKAAPHVTKYSQ